VKHLHLCGLGARRHVFSLATRCCRTATLCNLSLLCGATTIIRSLGWKRRCWCTFLEYGSGFGRLLTCLRSGIAFMKTPALRRVLQASQLCLSRCFEGSPPTAACLHNSLRDGKQPTKKLGGIKHRLCPCQRINCCSSFRCSDDISRCVSLSLPVSPPPLLHLSLPIHATAIGAVASRAA